MNGWVIRPDYGGGGFNPNPSVAGWIAYNSSLDWEIIYSYDYGWILNTSDDVGLPLYGLPHVESQFEMQQAVQSFSKGGSANRDRSEKKKGLIVQCPWIDLILDGKKTMDLRSNPTKIRGKIALLHKGKVFGYADLYGVSGPMTKAEMVGRYKEHRMPERQIYKSDFPYRYGWKFRNVKRLKRPRKYDHPQGAQIWVNL
jgi:hypothetical protein